MIVCSFRVANGWLLCGCLIAGDFGFPCVVNFWVRGYCGFAIL